MQGEFEFSAWVPALPEIFLALASMALLVAGAFIGNKGTRVVCYAALWSIAVTALILIGRDWGRSLVPGGMFVMDSFAGLTKLMILAGLFAVVAMSIRYLHQEQINRFEFPVLVMFAGLGMMLMVSANDMLSLYVALELQSLALYVLAAFHRDTAYSAEAGIKYFVLGAISSGMLLFGISLIYGFAGSTNFDMIAHRLEDMEAIRLPILVGLVFVLVGLAFKISAVPFHMWTPDVYQGAPTAVTTLFALVPKVAAMALLIRVLFGPFAAMAPDWGQIVTLLAVASMIVGAFAALGQENIKRLMAFSSISHMGYALIGVIVADEGGVGSVMLYLLIYMVMTAGVFAVILSMRRDNLAVESIGDLAGLARTRPFVAFAMAALLFSMAGVPPLAGFFGKFFIFVEAVDAGYYVLAVLGVLTSVVAAYYYLRIVKVMFFDESAEPFDPNKSLSGRAVLFVAALFVLTFIAWPQPVISIAYDASKALFIQ